MRPTPRMVYAFIFLVCGGLIVNAIFYLQDYLGLDPCPMCILSRYIFLTIGAIALVAASHGPKRTGARLYSSLIVLLAVAGIGVSARHSYLQHFPPKVESCGTDLEFLLTNLPFSQAFPKIFAGTGSCSAADWKFVGLSIPEWALVWFALFGALAVWAAWRRPQ